MIDNNIFDKVNPTYEKQVRSDFENKLQQIATSVRPNDSILNVNKQIIVQMMEDVKKYIIPIKNTNNKTNNIANNDLITSEEILTKKQAQFQKGLQTKQDEFNKLIKPVKPTTIDFSDKIDDEPIGSEMENRVAQAIAWREQQLSQVLEKQDTTMASDWINNGGQTKTIKANAIGSNTIGSNTNAMGVDGGVPRGVDGGVPRAIKIGDATQIDERNIINIKKVSFSDSALVDPYSTLDDTDSYTGLDVNTSIRSNVSESFMDKLKKKDTSSEVKTEFGVLKTEFGVFKTFITANINQLIESNKLVLQQQSKIIDALDRLSFNVGTI